MPALLLQKPSKTSKSKDHLAALSRRLELRDDDKISELLPENNTIQERLSNDNNEMNIAIFFFFSFFLSGFCFTTIHESQDCRGKGRAFL